MYLGVILFCFHFHFIACSWCSEAFFFFAIQKIKTDTATIGCDVLSFLL